MRNFFYALLIVVTVLAALFITANWKSIAAWWNRPKDGDKCILASEPAYVEGVIKDGQCVSANTPETPEENSGNSNNSGMPPSAQYDLQVSNPNGAAMYYQNNLASGGKSYSKSNVIIPYATKIKMVKIWQTNTLNNPFAGFYETDYKQYGAQSGFFDAKDIIKISALRPGSVWNEVK